MLHIVCVFFRHSPHHPCFIPRTMKWLSCSRETIFTFPLLGPGLLLVPKPPCPCAGFFSSSSSTLAQFKKGLKAALGNRLYEHATWENTRKHGFIPLILPVSPPGRRPTLLKLGWGYKRLGHLSNSTLPPRSLPHPSHVGVGLKHWVSQSWPYIHLKASHFRFPLLSAT